MEYSVVLGVTLLQEQLWCSLRWSTKSWIAIWAVSVREASGMVILGKPGGPQENESETCGWDNALDQACAEGCDQMQTPAAAWQRSPGPLLCG